MQECTHEIFVMAKIHWTIWTCGGRVVRRLKLQLFIIKFALCSLFYNEFADKYYVGDTCMEPMFWFVDHFTKFLGPICVVGVILLMLSITIIAYTIGLSFWWRQGIFPTLFLMSIGHWLLLNVIFHYYMAFITLPGFPPEGALIPEAVSICKKCIAPKPPRTHHCSVCNRCILKMDHHCPWLNNCIGHYNHRYFFLFCVYVWLSVIFVMCFGIPVAWEHYFQEYEPINSTYIPPNMNQEEEGNFAVSIIPSIQESALNSTDFKRTWSEAMYHSCIVYAALLCFAVFVAVGALLAWHSCLISRGETSIEGHINKKERLRLLKEGKKYENPYDFGLKKNWRLFLGIHSGRTWWHILFPSAHKPEGDGLRWHTQETIRWHDDHIWKKEMSKS